MRKLLFVITATILFEGITSVWAAKTDKKELTPADAKSAIKSYVMEKHDNEYLKVIKDKLTATSFDRKQKIPKIVKNQKQFLLEERADVWSHYGVKDDKSLKKVLELLCQDENLPNKTDIRNSGVKSIIFPDRTRTGEIDSTKCLVNTFFEIRNTTKDGFSDARYKVEMRWKVQSKYKKGKFVQVNKADIESLSVNKIDFLSFEAERIEQTVKRTVREWYLNIPENLQPEYLAQAIDSLSPIIIEMSKIQIEERNGLELLVKVDNPIRFHIDPYQFIPDSLQPYYENPVAWMELNPLFKVEIDPADYSKGQLTVVEMSSSVIKPQRNVFSDEELMVIKSNIGGYADLFLSHLKEYVQTKKGMSDLMNFFENEHVAVEVSYVRENGVQTKERNVKDYLRKVNAKEFSTAILKIDGDVKSNPKVRFSQEYTGSIYSDYTEKEIILQHKGDGFVITKIIVVPGSTVKR